MTIAVGAPKGTHDELEPTALVACESVLDPILEQLTTVQRTCRLFELGATRACGRAL
jgi:hypothetical protein